MFPKFGGKNTRTFRKHTLHIIQTSCKRHASSLHQRASLLQKRAILIAKACNTYCKTSNKTLQIVQNMQEMTSFYLFLTEKLPSRIFFFKEKYGKYIYFVI